ncbi:MAG: hypothetical protein K6E63_06020 [Lachnospiraceae bacterium]|nr:hypothetical protein [Lachnospiraceae bacterium]
MENRVGSDKIKGIWFAGIYYILAVMLYVINMFVSAVRPGVFATVFMAGVAAELVIRRQLSFKLFADRLVAAYFVYNALSVIWLVRGGFPVTVYIQEFIVSLLPVIFYYVGRACCENKSERFYLNFITAALIVGVLGILLQVIMPQFYIDYSFALNFVSKADAATCRVRMDSVVGSTVLGFISVAAMLASMPFIMNKKLRIFGALSMLINLVVAFMSNQRSAMVAAGLVIIYFNYLIFFQYKALDKKYFFIELALVAVAFIALCVVSMGAVMKIYYRLVSLPDAIGERSEQWIAAVNNMYSTWLGNGLGANGHRALGIDGAHVIADGGLVKMYCEQGIFGFSIFIYILILALNRGIKDLRHYCVEVGIIAIALLQSIGSNILAFQLTVPVFWFALGRINAALAKNGEDKK